MILVKSNYAEILRREVSEEIKQCSPRKNLDVSLGLTISDADVFLTIQSFFFSGALFFTGSAVCFVDAGEVLKLLSDMSTDEVVSFVCFSSGGGVTVDMSFGCVSLTAWGAAEFLIRNLQERAPESCEFYYGN